jgi:pyroglutamyl-peptidase
MKLKKQFIFCIVFLLFAISFQDIGAKNERTAEIILITGFEPFNGYEINPSELIAEELNGTNIKNATIIGVVLPVDYDMAKETIMEAIEKYNPSIIISLGLAYYRKMICIEKVAINFKSIYMNNKWIGIEKINATAPLLVFSPLPTFKITEKIRKEGIPARPSFFAGIYLCNYIFYITLHYIMENDLSIKAGFIHVPPLEEQAKHGMKLDKMVEAVRIAVETSMTVE